MHKIRAFIVDDSTVYRSQIRAALEGIPGVEVVGFASNGRLACDALRTKEADFITLDVEMPEMDGLATLAELRKLGNPARVVMLSAQTKNGAEATLQALRLGAFDFIAKPVLDPAAGSPAETIRKLLAPKLLDLHKPPPAVAAAVAATAAPVPVPSPRFPPVTWGVFQPAVVVIASSTGGPAALERLFGMLRAPLLCPVLIAQHMPPVFTATLAERLARISGLNVTEARNGDPLEPGRVYVAPGDWHLRVSTGTDGRKTCALDQAEQRNSVRPAADHLFESAAKAFGNRCLGIVLTGMGADGRDGAVALKQTGAPVLIQNRESCVVFGMPGAVREAGAYDHEEDLESLARRFAELGICKGLGGAA